MNTKATPNEKVEFGRVPVPDYIGGYGMLTADGFRAELDANKLAIAENANALARIEFLLKDTNKDKIISPEEEKAYDQETRIAIHGMNDAKKTTRNTQIYSLLARLVDIGLFLFWGFQLASR